MKISSTWIIFLTNFSPFSTTHLKSSITRAICMLNPGIHKHQKWLKPGSYIVCHKSTEFHSICKLRLRASNLSGKLCVWQNHQNSGVSKFSRTTSSANAYDDFSSMPFALMLSMSVDGMQLSYQIWIFYKLVFDMFVFMDFWHVHFHRFLMDEPSLSLFNHFHW